MGRLAELEAFVRVVESGSFSAAAERLEVAKSAISRRVTDLEERLGARLLNRTTRRLSLTDAGQQLYERAVRLLLEMDEAEQELISGSGALRGRLRVAAPHSFARHLAPVIDRFLGDHPEVELELDLNERTVNLVEEGFDMAVRIGKLADSRLVARRLAPIRMVTVASPSYLKNHGEPRKPEDLGSHHGLVYSHSPEGERWQFQDHEGRTRTVRVHARVWANSGEVLLQAAVGGLGVVMVPTFIAHRAIEAGEVVPILVGFESAPATAYAVFPSNRHLPARVRLFIDALAERFGDAPYWDECLRGTTT